MMGLIFGELKKYVEQKVGADAWKLLLKESGVGIKMYQGTQAYPDQEALALVAAACKTTGKPAAAILDDFGEFIVPALQAAGKEMIHPEWKLLDLLQNTESTMHTLVRARIPGSAPPALQIQRSSPSEVLITYTSARKLCPMIPGIVRGLGKSFGEKPTVSESTCMLKGDAACKFQVRVG